MTNIIKTVYENFECTYTCGLSLRKFLRLLSVIGMLSSIVYITVGTCIIVHIVQTEKVEWFPNSYYQIPEANGPVANRIVLPPPSSSNNGFDDFEIYRPKQNQYQPGIPFQPQQPNTIFPVNDESNVRLSEQQEKAIYYRRDVGLFICLAASLIVINFIQLVTDLSLFYSTLKGKRTTSFWVFFLLNIILWIMTLICFITIFSGGGIYLLLVFLSGTAIRVYTVYALHELMSDLRKPRASTGESLGATKEIKPEPRTMLDAEEGNCETTEPEEAANADDNSGAADGGDSTSSTKSLQPTQNEDELDTDANLVKAENQELQCSEVDKTDNEDDNDEGEQMLEPGVSDVDPGEVDEVFPETDASNEDANEEDDNDPDGSKFDDGEEDEPENTEATDDAAPEEETEIHEPDDDGENDADMENEAGEDNDGEEEQVDPEDPDQGGEDISLEDLESQIVPEEEIDQNDAAENDVAEESQVDIVEVGQEDTTVVENGDPEEENGVPEEVNGVDEESGVPEEENGEPEEANGEPEEENGEPEEENEVPEENGASEENDDIEPEIAEAENVAQVNEGDGDDATKDASQSGGENESPETDSPIESGENEQSPEVDGDVENGEEAKETSNLQKKRKRSKRKRRTKKA